MCLLFQTYHFLYCKFVFYFSSQNAVANPSIRLPHYETEDDDEEEIKTSFSVKVKGKVEF